MKSKIKNPPSKTCFKSTKMFCSIVNQTVHLLLQAFLFLCFLSGFELNIGKFCLKTSFQTKTKKKVRKLPWKSILTKCFNLTDFYLIFYLFFLVAISLPFSEPSRLTCDCTFWQTNYLSEKFRSALQPTSLFDGC